MKSKVLHKTVECCQSASQKKMCILRIRLRTKVNVHMISDFDILPASNCIVQLYNGFDNRNHCWIANVRHHCK